MGAVFRRVDRLSLEGAVFRPKRFDFLPKAIVFRSDVFALAHLRIVACRQELCGIGSNIVFFRGSELPKMMIGVQVRPPHPLRVGHSSENRMRRPVGGCAARTQRRQKCLDIRNVGCE
jgi:hypothetical protein